MEQILNVADIKTLFPNEWVLLGNPVMDESKIDVLSGIPLFHSKDKKRSLLHRQGQNIKFRQNHIDLYRVIPSDKKNYRDF
jgi:hypothetical protein